MDKYRKAMVRAQIAMSPDDFSAGDESGGSIRLFVTVFYNEMMKEEIKKLLDGRDDLMLGVCNGFQALIKLGLVPEGTVMEQGPDPSTLAMNMIGRHISKMVYTRTMTDKSLWLAGARLSGIYCNPASRGEGRFVTDDAWLHRLIANG